MTMNCNAAPEDEPRFPSTGGRVELNVCDVCGDEFPDRAFPDGTCGRTECRDTRGPVDPWLALYGTPAPFRFERNGEWYTCSWHPGHDKHHPANRDASHSACDPCLAKLNAEAE